MERTFLRFAPLGFVVALALAAYAYYSNLHRDAPRLNELAYLVLCPPSIFLMLTERASVLVQVFIITTVAVMNGCLYGTVALVVSKLFV